MDMYCWRQLSLGKSEFIDGSARSQQTNTVQIVHVIYVFWKECFCFISLGIKKLYTCATTIHNYWVVDEIRLLSIVTICPTKCLNDYSNFDSLTHKFLTYIVLMWPKSDDGVNQFIVSLFEIKTFIQIYMVIGINTMINLDFIRTKLVNFNFNQNYLIILLKTWNK